MTKRQYTKELSSALSESCIERVKICVAKVEGILSFPLTVKAETALHLAVVKNDLSMVKSLLSLGADINATTQSRESVLHLAVDNARTNAENKRDPSFVQRNQQMVQYFLGQSIDVNLRNDAGQSALHKAVMNGSESLVKSLLMAKVNVNLVMRNGSTALHCAVKISDGGKRMSIVESLVKFGAKINAINNTGNTALYLSVKQNDIDLVSYLIANGADVNCKTKTQLTPLFAAVKLCNLKMIDLLTKNGASICEKNNFGDNLLHYALKTVAQGSKRMKLVKLLLKNGLNVNAKNRDKRSALFTVLEVEDEDMLLLLLKRGTCPNTVDCKGLTPLHVAVKEKSEKKINILLEHGAIANENSHKFPRNCEPLICWAINVGAGLPLIQQLLDEGSDFNKRSIKHNETALNLSIMKAQHEVTDLLLSRGADISLKDRLGFTPLHMAVQQSVYCGNDPYYPQLVETLLKLGADVCDECRWGYTPFQRLKLLSDNIRSPFYSGPPGKVSRILLLHFALMNSQNQHLGKKNITAITSKNKYHFLIKQFIREIGLMQITKIGSSSICYYDLLLGKLDHLVWYARSEDVAEAIETGKYKKFQNYCERLLINYLEGKIRLNLIEKTAMILECAPFDLPEEMAVKVCEYLSNEELLNFEKTISSMVK